MGALLEAYRRARNERWRGEEPMVIAGLQRETLPFRVIPVTDRPRYPDGTVQLDEPINEQAKEARIAGGTHSCVYRGTITARMSNPATGRRERILKYPVAVKFIQSERTLDVYEDPAIKDEDKLARIEEAELQTRRAFMDELAWIGLDYPAINQFMYVDMGTYKDPGFWVIVSDLCGDENLGEALERYHAQKLPLRDGSSTFDETALACCPLGIACGIAYLHFLGLVHRNLNPANVLLAKSFPPDLKLPPSDKPLPPFRPKLTGFGSMTNIDSVDLQNDEAEATPFTAPELARPHEWRITEKIDVYALGVTMAVIFGLDLKSKPVSDYVEFPIGKALSDIVKNCLEPNPSVRWNIVQVVDALMDSRIFSDCPSLQTLQANPAAFMAEYDEYKRVLFPPEFTQAMREYVPTEVKRV